eukprot:8006652-Pyramimonas_sp.AAC.1
MLRTFGPPTLPHAVWRATFGRGKTQVFGGNFRWLELTCFGGPGGALGPFGALRPFRALGPFGALVPFWPLVPVGALGPSGPWGTVPQILV